MTSKKKEIKAGPVEGTIERVIANAVIPATQKWISIDELRRVAREIDDGKKRPKH